ncbi:hypothetical protein L202_05812 [Cryptococcus amylolentus CBS 6039]|uniref:ferric-chelate reductase (NADPH) n=1 Tax=Cryptococcus amylolentus CBS 6039 TaxID=1295533 RepID=A0A1E3HHI9_9TREE|nr:hypothetical protein L202_05812 [Cryptococcus amylolentus CBS 6039]ODN75812.1 hypothetical protein L202_05812 [Cryptococcus amylolentus CBS 6039]
MSFDSTLIHTAFDAIAIRAAGGSGGSLSTGNTTSASSTQAAASGGGGGGGGGGAGGGGTDTTEPPKFLIFLAGGLLALFFLSHLPRLLVRLASSSNGGEFFKGNLLSTKEPQNNDMAGSTSAYAGGLTKAADNPPKHWPSMSAVVPGGELVNITVPYAHMTIGQMAVCGAWVAIFVISMVYMNDPLADGNRAGYVAVWLLPVVVGLGMKVNDLGLLVGKGYEKLNYLHRFTGRLLFVGGTFHAGYYAVKWVKKGTFAESASTPFITAGIVAWAAFMFMGVTSVPFIRTRIYGFFWMCHWIGYTVAVIALAYHEPPTAMLAIVSLIIYGKDIILRLALKTRVTNARLVPLPGSQSIQVITSFQSGWRAGQHVFLRVPALRQVGGMSFWENHPFSVASAEGDEMVLVVKRAGDWTRALYELASQGDMNGEKGMEKGYANVGKECRVIVEGPYGGPGPLVMASYSSVLLVSGGSGVTFALSVLDDLIKKAFMGHCRAKTIHFVWVCKNYDDAEPLIPRLVDLMSRASTTNLTPKISIYLTRSQSSSAYSEGGIEIVHRRPELANILDGVVSRTRVEVLSGNVGTCGLVVGVCGPMRLVNETKKAVRVVPWQERRDIGGVTVHTEAFGW